MKRAPIRLGRRPSLSRPKVTIDTWISNSYDLNVHMNVQIEGEGGKMGEISELRTPSAVDSIDFPSNTATIEDVARQAGVSRQTVSNVLNAPERVRPDTIATVRVAIDSLGYRANRHARNLRKRSSRVIGYCLPPLTALGNSVLDSFLHTLAESAEANGYHLLLVTSSSKSSEVETYQELAAQSAVDGLVIAQTEYNDPRPSELRKRNIPFVSFGRTWGDTDHSWVDVDGRAGTRLAVEHLLRQGHRRFAWLGHAHGSVSNDERERGVRDALQQFGTDSDTTLRLINASDTDEQTHQRLQDLIDQPDAPTAYVTMSDLHAITVLRELDQRGLVPGKDVAVVGFDDSPVAPFAGGGLTSVRQPVAEAARELIRLLTMQFADPRSATEGVLLQPELIVRHTG
jgi:DNA-binding LacI/PurR family transcriptional regulator